MDNDKQHVLTLQEIIKNNKHLSEEIFNKNLNKYLDTIKINENSSAGFTSLFRASAIGDFEVVDILLKRKADPNKFSEFGQSPIFCAAENGNLDIIKNLVKYGAEIDPQDHNGKTPLMFAAGNGNLEATKFLVESGADINKADKTGNTSLLYAFKKLDKEVVRFLIENGADINIKNKNGASVSAILEKARNNAKTVSEMAKESIVKKPESTKFRNLVTNAKKSSYRGR